MPIACAHIPRFAVEVERQRRSDIATRSVLIGEGGVFDYSLGAETSGVRRGMRMSEAIGLCHRAVVLPPDLPHYQRRFDGVLDFLGVPDPEVAARPSTDVLNKALKGLYAKEVPYSAAPPLAGSNFEELKELALLDAKTHNFAEAWDAGYTGTGVTVGVLDGGTDFGHPDLIGTWQTWSGLTGSRAAWNGWPKAFDPFGTLQWLAAPSQIDQGLSWYVKTTAVTCKDWANKAAQASCSVKFSTKTGPSRNFGAPTGTKQHTYLFPAGVSKSGNVRLGSHPDDYLLALFGERPAFLVTDSTTAGVFDTVYVDLDNDRRFDDEKPVTKASPVSYRDMDGDGYTDLSGGLLYFISDGVTRLPGGVDVFGGTFVRPPGETLAWTGDFDPAIGGHGTLTASNVVGQGVINGKAPCFEDLAEVARERFGHLLEAFEFGTPPHGGIASGLDRLCMVLAGAPNIREVIPFPKNQAARDMMAGAPSAAEAAQLRELHLQIVRHA